jgi:hypothetical protein
MIVGSDERYIIPWFPPLETLQKHSNQSSEPHRTESDGVCVSAPKGRLSSGCWGNVRKRRSAEAVGEQVLSFSSVSELFIDVNDCLSQFFDCHTSSDQRISCPNIVIV